MAEKVKKFREAGDDVVVVVSAMSGETNRLIGLANQIMEQPVPRELDVMVSTGEQVTIALLSMALIKRGVPAVSYTGNQVRILTDSAHTKARILHIDDTHIRADLKAGRVVVVAGFQGVDGNGNITTLGRGGSRYHRGGPGGGVEGRRMPDLHRRRRRLHHRSARSAAGPPAGQDHLRGNAGNGQPRFQGAADPGGRVRRQVQRSAARVLHSFQEGPGTLITIDDEEESMEQPIISGIAFNRDEAKLTIRGVPDTPAWPSRSSGRSVPPMWKST